MDYARSVNFSLENIFVMDGSKRSSKSNAFFSGFGKHKRIALFDTLIAKHTIAELTATGTPAIILPYPYHRDRHQAHNAAGLVSAGGAICIEDARNLTGNVASLRAKLLPLLSNEKKLESMGESLRMLAKPQAAGDVAKWLVG